MIEENRFKGPLPHYIGFGEKIKIFPKAITSLIFKKFNPIFFKPKLLIEIRRLRRKTMILGAPQTSIHSVLEDVLDTKIGIYEKFHFLITFLTHFCVYVGGRGSCVAPKS